MELPQDLKNYRAPDSSDPFQLISPDLAVLLVVVAGVAGYWLGSA